MKTQAELVDNEKATLECDRDTVNSVETDMIIERNEIYTNIEFEVLQQLSENVQTDSDSPLKCLKRRSHASKTRGPPYVCEHCGHECRTSALLATHRYRKHTLKSNQVSCVKCNKNFDTKKQLERHKRRPTCEPYPKIACEHCEKTIIGVANYKIHLRCHTKEFPYFCHKCGKSFMMSDHLKQHILTKHENQRYICEHPDCGKQFQTGHCLKTHMYRHVEQLPFKCKHCERMMPTKGRLRFHIKRCHKIIVSVMELDKMRVAETISITPKLKPSTEQLNTKC